jgi:hypothetical protein
VVLDARRVRGGEFLAHIFYPALCRILVGERAFAAHHAPQVLGVVDDRLQPTQVMRKLLYEIVLS